MALGVFNEINNEEVHDHHQQQQQPHMGSLPPNNGVEEHGVIAHNQHDVVNAMVAHDEAAMQVATTYQQAVPSAQAVNQGGVIPPSSVPVVQGYFQPQHHVANAIPDRMVADDEAAMQVFTTHHQQAVPSAQAPNPGGVIPSSSSVHVAQAQFPTGASQIVPIPDPSTLSGQPQDAEPLRPATSQAATNANPASSVTQATRKRKQQQQQQPQHQQRQQQQQLNGPMAGLPRPLPRELPMPTCK